MITPWKLSAAGITALGVVCAELAAMPKRKVEQCLEVDMEVAGIAEKIADAVEGCDTCEALLNFAKDAVATVEKTRERIAESDAEEAYRQRRVA